MHPDKLEKNDIYENYEKLFPFSNINNQDILRIYLNNQFPSIPKNEENDNNISNIADSSYDKDDFVNPFYIKSTESKTKTAPIFYTFDDIKQKIFRNELYEKKFLFDIKNIFVRDEQLESLYLKKKRFRNFTDDYYINGFLSKENYQECEKRNKKKRGRKTEFEGREEHNRMSPDNIIKKIKKEFFKYITQFLNNIIKDKRNIIYKIDYCFINQLNKEIDLGYLDMSLKNLFSKLSVSPKYKNILPDSNKNFIKNLLTGKTDEVIKFAFDMTFRDWIDIFSFKKEVKDLLNKYSVKDDNNNICKKINESLVTVDDLLNNLAKYGEQKYFSNFTFYLYNYEFWFFKKKARKSKSKNN